MSKQTPHFQAEVAQLLHLVTPFIRTKKFFCAELVSNARCLRQTALEALNNNALYEDAPNLEVRVAFDKDAKTLTIDNGIGMSAQEATTTWAIDKELRTKDFMRPPRGRQKKADAKEQGQLIGQFGAALLRLYRVRDKITVESRRAGVLAEEGVRWISGGTGDFEVEKYPRSTRHQRDFAPARRSRGIPERLETQIHHQIPTTSACPFQDGKGRVERRRNDQPGDGQTGDREP